MTKLTLLEESSSEEFCVSVIPISQISEDEAGSKNEVTEAAAGLLGLVQPLRAISSIIIL